MLKNVNQLLISINGTAAINSSAWAIPSAQIDITKPSPAAGIGGIGIQCKEKLNTVWAGLKGGQVNLSNSYILADIGRIAITDLQAGNIYCSQEYKLWKDDQNKFGTSVKLQYSNSFPFLYNTLANGNEVLLAIADTNPLVDRPVNAAGQPFDIHSKNSILLLAATKTFKAIYLYDDNIILDNYDPKKPKETLPKPQSLALTNALFQSNPG